MNITVYSNSAPLNRATRSLTGAKTISGHLREGSSILDPSITVEYDSALLNKNYAYIADYGRYYYFTEPPQISGKEMILRMHCDVLYTYWPIIAKSQCIARRSSSHYNKFLPDDAISEEEGWIYNSGVIGQAFTPNNGTYVLTVVGGV